MKETIAVLGLGAMGSRMATRLLDAGHSIRIFNRSVEAGVPLVARGAIQGQTPRQAVAGCDVVVCCVRDDDAARGVWLDDDTGALPVMQAGSIAVESSTLTPACARELALAARNRGVHFLDAPVVGSRPQAEAGQLAYLVGGEAKVLERVRPVLELMGAAVIHVGGNGSGAILKLVVNALLGIQVAAYAELLAMAAKTGLDPAAALPMLGSLPVCSPAAKGAASLIVAADHAPRFPIDLILKDLRYAEELAASVGARLPTTTAVRGVFERAQEEGDGGLNMTGVAKLFE